MKKEIKDYVCFDLETTGLSTHTAEIIEIGAVKVRNMVIVERFSTLVKPSEPISDIIIQVTGITNKDLKAAPDISKALSEFIEFINGETLLGHNIEQYDLPILKRVTDTYCITITNDNIDTLTLSKEIAPELPSHSLEAMCDYYSITNSNAHRALSDAEATAELYNCIINNTAGSPERVKTKKKERPYCPNFSGQTQALITLKGILAGITCDNILSESEVYFLKNWLDDNAGLEGNYPFDIVIKEVEAALEDGILEQHELDRMLIIFKEILNPVETKSGHTENLNFSGKKICLSGDFETGTKDEVSKKLTALGAVVCSSVTKAVDYLIVGENGSLAWSGGNYGAKVKKALEMQEKGHHIQILREREVFKTQEAANV